MAEASALPAMPPKTRVELQVPPPQAPSKEQSEREIFPPFNRPTTPPTVAVSKEARDKAPLELQETTERVSEALPETSPAIPPAKLRFPPGERVPVNSQWEITCPLPKTPPQIPPRNSSLSAAAVPDSFTDEVHPVTVTA